MVKPVLLVHGAWHGAWCWAALQSELDRRGVPSFAIDRPGHGASLLEVSDLYGDAQHLVASVARLTERTGSDLVVVGHSYGGAVITEAASRQPAGIAHLVYVAAHALARGESVTDTGALADHPPKSLRASARALPDGTTVLEGDEFLTTSFYASCNPAVVPAALARLGPQGAATFTQKVTGDPRSTIPSTYVACIRDEAIDYGRQQVMAARCGTVVTFDTDHSPFLSMTAETADVIETVARQ